MANAVLTFLLSVLLISSKQVSNPKKVENDKDIFLTSIKDFIRGDCVMFTFGYKPYIKSKCISFMTDERVYYADGSSDRLETLSLKELKCLYHAIEENYDFIKKTC